MRHILLTGSTGFLGSHLLEALLQQGDKVTTLKRSTSDTWRIKHLLGDTAVFDIDIEPLENAFKASNFDAVIHTACSYGRKGEPAHSVAETNLLFSLRLLDAATHFKTGAFLNTDTFFNTRALQSKYLGAYALSKKQFSEWLQLRQSDIQIINLKLQHVYGTRDDKTKFVPWLISQLQQGADRIPLTNGTQLRDFVYVDDVVSAFLLTLKKANELGPFAELSVGTGTLVEVKTFVLEIYKEMQMLNPNLRTELGFGDIPLHPGELTQPEAGNSELALMGWKPNHSRRAGIKKVIIS